MIRSNAPRLMSYVAMRNATPGIKKIIQSVAAPDAANPPPLNVAPIIMNRGPRIQMPRTIATPRDHPKRIQLPARSNQTAAASVVATMSKVAARTRAVVNDVVVASSASTTTSGTQKTKAPISAV